MVTIYLNHNGKKAAKSTAFLRELFARTYVIRLSLKSLSLIQVWSECWSCPASSLVSSLFPSSTFFSLLHPPNQCWADSQTKDSKTRRVALLFPRISLGVHRLNPLVGLQGQKGQGCVHRVDRLVFDFFIQNRTVCPSHEYFTKWGMMIGINLNTKQH